CCDPHLLVSFPTRRSSDLLRMPCSGIAVARAPVSQSRTARKLGFVEGTPAATALVSSVVPQTVSEGSLCSSLGEARQPPSWARRSEEHTSELQSRENLVCR